MNKLALVAACGIFLAAEARNSLARTPPMGCVLRTHLRAATATAATATAAAAPPPPPPPPPPADPRPPVVPRPPVARPASPPARRWMSWEIFRCNLETPTDDCTDKKTTACISEALYQGITDGLVSSGLAAAGYASVHMDVGAGTGLREARAGARARLCARPLAHDAHTRTLAHAALFAHSPCPGRSRARRRTAGSRSPPRATRRRTSCAATSSASPAA